MRIPWGPMGPTGAPCGTHVGFTCFFGSFGSSPQASVRANNADIWSKEVGIIHSGPPSLSLSICNIRPSGTRPSLSLITSGSGSFGLHFGDGSGVCKFSIAKSQRPHCLVYPKLHCKLLYSQRPHCKLYSQRPHHLVYPRFSVMHSPTFSGAKVPLDTYVFKIVISNTNVINHNCNCNCNRNRNQT